MTYKQLENFLGKTELSEEKRKILTDLTEALRYRRYSPDTVLGFKVKGMKKRITAIDYVKREVRVERD